MRLFTRILLSVPAAVLVAAPVMATLHQTPVTPAVGPQFDLAKMMGKAPVYESPTRIERTPRLDGAFHRDEWDLLWEEKTVVPQQVVAPTPVAVRTETVAVPPAGPTTGQTSTGNTSVPPATSDPKNVVLPPPPKEVPKEQPQTVPPVAVPLPPPVTIFKATYMNWEPGKLYFAASMPAGNDLVISIDGGGNGFDKGQDNLELRFSPGAPGAPAHVSSRMLFSDGGATPAWHDAPGFILATQATTGAMPDGNVLIEVTVVDPGINVFSAQIHSQFGVRADVIPTSTPPIDSSVARATTLVYLDDFRASELPDNLTASVGEKGRKVVPGDQMSMRFDLVMTGSANPIKAVEISGQGPLYDLVNSLRVPSPTYDAKGHAAIDFPTRMNSKAPVGYGVVQAILTGDGWGPAKVEASVRVAPPVEFEASSLTVKTPLKDGKINGKAFIITNMDTRQEGSFEVVAPAGWIVVDGNDKTFLLYGKGVKATRGFVVQPPPDTRGTFMLTLKARFLGSTIERPYFITIL